MTDILCYYHIPHFCKLSYRSFPLWHYNNNHFTALWGEPVPEETFMHSHLSWSPTILYQLPSSTTIHSILPVQLTCFTVFLHHLSPKSSLVNLLVWNPTLHTPYISSPNHSFLFATHAHITETSFAVVPRLCHPFQVSISTLYLEVYLLIQRHTSTWPPISARNGNDKLTFQYNF